MSDKNGRKLQDLTKAELIEKVTVARDIWHQDQKTIESLTDQVGEQVQKVDSLEATLRVRDATIAQLIEKLEALCTPIAVACRQVGDAKEMLKPYWKRNNGGQHQSAPTRQEGI